MPKKSIKNHSKNKNVNKNSIKININTSSKRRKTTPSAPIPRYSQPIIINNPANNNQHEYMHMLNTFKNDLDELRRVRLNNFENSNIPKSNALSENLRQSNVVRPNLATQRVKSYTHHKPILSSSDSSLPRTPSYHSYNITDSIPSRPTLTRTNSNSSIISNLSDSNYSILNDMSSHIPSSSNHSLSHTSSVIRPNETFSIPTPYNNNSIVNEMKSHIPSSHSVSTHSSSNKTIRIQPEEMIILDPPNTKPLYNNPNTPIKNDQRIFIQRQKVYKQRRDDSDSEIEPSNIRIPNSNLRLKMISQETTRTPYNPRRGRFITQYGEQTNQQPTPPPQSEKPSRTNLLAIMDAEHEKPVMKAIPNTNDVQEMSSNGFVKPKQYDKKQFKSDTENARYHSRVDDFNKKNPEHKTKYNTLLQEYTNKYPQEPNSEFYKNGKPKEPSKTRYNEMLKKLGLQKN